MARPLKEINWVEVEKRMEAGNTAKQIAKALRVNIETFYDRFKREFECGFSDYSNGIFECGDANIQYTQYLKAIGGNIQMLTLLGKERLGQGKESVSETSLSTIKTELEQGNIKQHDDKPLS